MEIQLWAPPGRSAYEVADKANEWIAKHPDMPPFARFLQDYVSSVWPCLWHGTIPYTVLLTDDCVKPCAHENQTFDRCAICHNDLCTALETLACAHTFHTMCIQQWIRKNPTCPICRASVQG